MLIILLMFYVTCNIYIETHCHVTYNIYIELYSAHVVYTTQLLY